MALVGGLLVGMGRVCLGVSICLSVFPSNPSHLSHAIHVLVRIEKKNNSLHEGKIHTLSIIASKYLLTCEFPMCVCVFSVSLSLSLTS